jgi:putative membrane protein
MTAGQEGMSRRLHPASLISRSLQLLPQMLAGGAGYAAIIQREGFGRILIFAIIAAGIGFVFALLSWWRFRYTIGRDEIVIERGILHRQRRVIPFDRVQDIAIERPLLARLLGTAKVKIETGGSSTDEGHLDMILLDDAFTLRDKLRRWQGSAVSAEAAEDTEQAFEEPLLFAMDVKRVLYSGLFNFSLVFLAVIFAALQYLDDFGLLRLEDWFNPDRAESASANFSIRATILLIVLLLTLGVTAGIFRTLARDFGFRLTRAAAGFRRRRGLLTLSEAVIPLHRMQLALVESGPVTRRLGWHSLAFQTLGADQKEGGVQVAAPFARIEEIDPLLGEARFPSPPSRENFHGVPRRALVKWALPWLVPAIGMATAASLIDPRAFLAAAMFLLISVVAALRWRKHEWAIDARALTVSGGLFKRTTWIIPFDKAQSISVSRGPLQRRLSLATLHVDTAGASLLRAPELSDLDSAEADRLAARLLFLFYRHRAQAAARRSRPKPATVEDLPEPHASGG